MSLRSLAPALRATAAARPSALALPAVARAASTLTSGTPRIPTHKGPTKVSGEREREAQVKRVADVRLVCRSTAVRLVSTKEAGAAG
jgi:hypothetical protein